MANRTMQAKVLKMRRQLRKLPYRTNEGTAGAFTEHSGTPIPPRLKAEGVSVPRTPNRELVQGYKHRANSLKTTMAEANEEKMRRYGYLTLNTPPGKKEIQDQSLARLFKRFEEDDAREIRKLKCIAASLFRRG